MNYNNFGNSNGDGHSRLPRPSYSGTLSDGYDESKTKRQKTESAFNGAYSPSLYLNSSHYGNSWNTGYTAQLHPFTPHNQYFHPTPPSTQYNFSSPPDYTRNCIPPVNKNVPYSSAFNLPKRPSSYCESAQSLKDNNDYQRSISSEDIAIATVKERYLVVQEKGQKDKLMNEISLVPSSEDQTSLKSKKIPKKDTGLANFSTKGEHNMGLDEEDDDEHLESEGLGKVVLVPGTSIALITDEDVKKWREERKKMWLLKISNNKKKHMQDMGIKEDELKNQPSIFKESRKEKQFIQSIQNQVQRGNPKVDLNLKLIQREFANENSQLLDFISELGDAGLLEYELSQEEKDVLFGTSEDNNKNNYKPNYRNRKANLNRSNFPRNK